MEGQAMSGARDQVMMFATLLGFWLLLNGSLATDVWLVGGVAAGVITLLFRQGLSVAAQFRFNLRALLTAPAYGLYFLKALVQSNLRLARIVLSPALPITPGIVKVRTRLQSPMGRLLLANSITLTPGTLSVELDGEWLYVHWVTVETEDIEAATAEIVAGFERYLEVMYG
jgi:multicomponent Na+:H+ antiporter subunit E